MALLISGCADWHHPTDSATPAPSPMVSNQHLDYLLRVQASSPPERESLWRSLRASERGTPVAELRTALLQSFEGHSGYAPDAAEGRLRVLLQSKPQPDIASVAKLRLNELRTDHRCQETVQSMSRDVDRMKSRLDEVVDIERQIESKVDRGRH